MASVEAKQVIQAETASRVGLIQALAFTGAQLVDRSNLLAGALMLAFSALGGWYIVRSLVRALSFGYSPGKLGAIHQAGSAQYSAFIAACCVGIGLMALLAFLGLRWCGLINGTRR